MSDNHDNQSATISVEEASRILGISRSTGYRGVRTGAIPAIRIGRRWIVPTARLHELLGLRPGDGAGPASFLRGT